MTKLSTALVFSVGFSLVACGGGGPDNTSPIDTPAPIVTPAASTPAESGPASGIVTGTSCAVRNNLDVMGGMAFQTSHRTNARDYGCLIVSRDAGHPVFDGSQSARFEVRPGDCSASASFDDCTHDRSRHEINETTQAPSRGQTLVYTTHLFIPDQTRFRPKGRNTMFLTQINFVDAGEVYGTLAYLEVAQGGELWIRTDKGFTFGIERQYPVYSNPYAKWIKISWEIRSSDGPDGYLKAYVDDVLKVHESRATLPSATATNRLKIGIYNVFTSRALEPFDNQVVYFDGVTRSVR